MTHEELQELLVDHLRDTYDAEKQLVKALPKIAKAAESSDLADAVQAHLEETRGHVSRLEQVFQLLEISARGKACKGMKGLLDEGSEIMQEKDKGAARDLCLIAAAQKVEHYEISAYGTACTLAEQLGMEEAVALLRETEGEETQADEKLTQIAATIYEDVEDQDEDEESEDEANQDEEGEDGEEEVEDDEEAVEAETATPRRGVASAKPAPRKKAAR